MSASRAEIARTHVELALLGVLLAVVVGMQRLAD